MKEDTHLIISYIWVIGILLFKELWMKIFGLIMVCLFSLFYMMSKGEE